MKTIVSWLLALVTLFLNKPSTAQQRAVIYDEQLVPQYVLPELLTSSDGKIIDAPEAWQNLLRAETLHNFEIHVYGKTPLAMPDFLFREVKKLEDFLDGKATLREVELVIKGAVALEPIRLLVITPNGASDPVPAFVGLNFNGNHTIHPSTEITLGKVWDSKTGQALEAEEASRGSSQSRWPVERIIDWGYALITCHYEDFDPDFDDGFKNGIHPAFAETRNESSWGAIGAWAWGLSRLLDFALANPAIDGQKVAVIGHSRLGKAALWAAAQDERFALVVSNNSGCGGAALSRREFGETIERITSVFPHWFCSNLSTYGNRVNALPVDQHQLIALLAPRPVYIASAAEDRWADPQGEFLSAVHATPVYKLLGTSGLTTSVMPAVNQPVFGQIAYHVRSGEHDLTPYDWELYLDFADLHLKDK